MDELTDKIACTECHGIGEFDCLDDCGGWCIECKGRPISCSWCNGDGHVDSPTCESAILIEKSILIQSMHDDLAGIYPLPKLKREVIDQHLILRPLLKK